MDLDDELADVAIRIRGLRDASQAAREWPSIFGALGHIVGRIRRIRPQWRRSPRLDAAADRCHRATAEAPIAGEMRAEALELIAAIKAMVGPDVPTWSPAPAPRRR